MIPDHDEGVRQMKYAYDKGINTFDTANVYSAGESEVILGKFLKQHKIQRESVVIMTKTYNPDGTDEARGPAGMANQRGLSRKVSLTTGYCRRMTGSLTRSVFSLR